MKTYKTICCGLVGALFAVLLMGAAQNDRINELETERDIYQSRYEAAETALSKKREITLPSTETCEIDGNAYLS